MQRLIYITLLFIGYLSQVYALEIPTPRVVHSIKGANDVMLAVQEWGVATGKPIIFLHAWSQSHLGWLPQIQSQLATRYRLITMDLRGHGNSAKPLELTQYNNGDVWADDLHAVINNLQLDAVTLVGWSYGTIMIADYIKKYGQDKVAAINFVAGTSAIGVPRVQNYFGADAKKSESAFDNSLPTQALAMLDIADVMLPSDTDKALYGFLIATNMMVPPFVRKAMMQRSVDYKATYEALTVPTLFTHGEQDKAILPIAAKEGASFVKGAKLSLYEGAQHGPHWNNPERFNQELDALVTKATQK